MSSVVKSLTVLSHDGDRKQIFTQQELHKLLDETPTMENINAIFLDLGKIVCEEKNYDIFLPDGRKIFDKTRLFRCPDCKNPFSELFLLDHLEKIQKNPNSKKCVVCAKDTKNKPRQDLALKIPKEFEICPKCKKQTVARYDGYGSPFIGCSGYRGKNFGCQYTRTWPD